MAGFEAAIAGGYGIELDVQETRDGQPVVFHDYTLERLTDQTGAVAARNLDELQNMTLKGSTQHVDSLAKVLSTVDGRTPVLIEVKTRKHRVGRLEAAVAAVAAAYQGPAAVMSFNIHSMIWFKTHAPETTRGLVATRWRYGGRNLPLSVEFLPLAYNAKRCGADFVAYDFRLIPTPETVDLRKKGMPVLTWTVKRAEDREKAEQSADGMIFEGWRP
jgi:glycerophosphoryl diester phosphodiesterase